MSESKCLHCGGPDHQGVVCHRVKRIRYDAQGSVEEVEYFPPPAPIQYSLPPGNGITIPDPHHPDFAD